MIDFLLQPKLKWKMRGFYDLIHHKMGLWASFKQYRIHYRWIKYLCKKETAPLFLIENRGKEKLYWDIEKKWAYSIRRILDHEYYPPFAKWTNPDRMLTYVDYDSLFLDELLWSPGT